MSGRQVVAWVLIGAGAVALLARVGPGTGWLWVALAAAGFLAVYRQQGTYAFLVVGSILAGVAAGILLEGAWGWPGAFLMSLGIGFLVIDRIEPQESRWPIYPAAILIGLGLIYWLFSAGIVQSLWFPFLLIIAGIYLLRRTDRSEWVEVGEPERTEEPVEGASVAPERPEAPGDEMDPKAPVEAKRREAPPWDEATTPASRPTPGPGAPPDAAPGEASEAEDVRDAGREGVDSDDDKSS